MSGFAVRGWCPDAWRPMAAGDGLLVRVRPRLGRLTRAQLLALCEAADAYGNGRIDLTMRANLQIRGVDKAAWPALIARLVDAGLVDADPVREMRRNLLVAPGWRAGDDTHRIADALIARLDAVPDLPGKAGFVIDAGDAPVLTKDSGDFRIERGAHGGLILRADGTATGVALDHGGEVDALIGLARRFAERGVARMADSPILLADAVVRPVAAAAPMRPGMQAGGMALGLPFGRVEASALRRLVMDGAVTAIRLTPWRIMLCEGLATGGVAGFIDDSASDLLHVDACVGAPACPQASVETRALALRLAPSVEGRLHVSGCAKGCARARPADVVLTGRDGRYDLAFAARAGAPPVVAGLDAGEILARFGVS